MECQDYEGKDLDKDIIHTNNKVYSEDTCIFVHHDINMLLVERESKYRKYKIGVSYDGRSHRYSARSHINNNQHTIGYFDTEQEAHNAYLEFKSKHIYNVAQEQEQPLRGYLERISNEYLDKITTIEEII